MKTLTLVRIALAGSLALLGSLGWGQATAPGLSLDRYSVEIQTVDDYDVTTGQTVSVDPNGFDVKVVVSHRGAAVSHAGGETFGASDVSVLASSVVRFIAILPDGEELPLPTLGDCTSSGISYSHLRIDPAALARFDALSNPEVSVMATLSPRSAVQAAGASSIAPSSRPIRLGLKISALRSGQPVVPYVYRKVENLQLKPVFSAPTTMRSDEAFIAGQAPNVPSNLGYFLWLRYTVQGSSISHFVPVAPPTASGWRADLGYLKPDTTYRIVAFASPHPDTSTFAANGWRADAYAISPEITETIVPAGFHFSAQWLGVLLALFFITAAMLTLRNPHHDPETKPNGELVDSRPPPSFTARAHKALAWVLLALATVTIVNYYEFFTNIVATALRGDPIIGQDWNLQNSGGISLLIMSYSVSLGLCVELGLYKLITLWRERHTYGLGAAVLSLVWLAAIGIAGWCAFAFIVHIGEFYNTQPALRELGHLAGAAELVIFFTAIGGLMPMEHENWAHKPVPSADGRSPWQDRLKGLFKGRKQAPATATAAVHMEPATPISEPSSTLL